MSDHDTHSAAWQVPPSAYLARRPPKFSVPDTPQSMYVAMRDGCQLAVDVYRPGVLDNVPPPKLPTVVIFTPYYRRFQTLEAGVEGSPNCARYRDFFVARGYAVVLDTTGHVVAEAAKVRPNAALELEFYDGKVGAIAGGSRRPVKRTVPPIGQGDLFKEP